MTAKKATHQLTKQHNRDLVLKTIIENETISRAEIARVTKLTRTTVSDIVARLLAEKLVQEVGQGLSIGGKPSILLSLAADSRYLIGLNLTQDKFIGAVVNLRGEIKETVETPVQGDDGVQALQLVYQTLDQLVKKNWKPIVGIGVGAPGLINTSQGIVFNAVNLDWQDLPLAHLLEERYHLPISVMNDSQATAIGEFVYGDHKFDNNLIVVNVRHGIGAGFLINGQLFQGDGGGAGEIGHVVVQEDGLLCRCGRKGCLETIASVHAVTQRVNSLSKSTVPILFAEIVSKFSDGDPLVQQVVLEAGHYLGVAIGSLIGTLNIRKVVLNGDMTRFGQSWLDSIRKSMLQAALGRMTQETQLEIGKLDYRACILGSSANLLLDDYSLLFMISEN
jgi:predicted NBD/HSP70 family sugar kinase